MQNPAPGWYPDPAGGQGRKYWDGVAWHDAIPTRPGFQIPGKPPRKISAKALLIAAAVFVAVVVIGTFAQSRDEEAKSASDSTTTRTATTTTATTSPIPLTLMPSPNCDDAPAGIVAAIDATFTNGEHLENAQSVDLPKAMTIVGGNIVDAEGTRVSSQDSWLFSGGAVYALTSDARRRTMLPDGRDVFPDWPQYNDQVGACVGLATP